MLIYKTNLSAMPLSQAEVSRAYRARKRNALGDTEYKAAQAEKRKIARARANSLPIPTENVKVPKKKTVKNDSLKEKVIAAKLKHAEENNKTIQISSILAQWVKLNNLYEKMTSTKDFNNFKWVAETDKVISFVNNTWKTPNSKNAQFQAISSILSAFPEYKKLYKFYSELSSKNRIAITTESGENKMSESEQKSILPWSEMSKLYKKTDNIADKALIAFYTLMPPRRSKDISLLTLATEEEEEGLENDFNYIIVDNKNRPVRVIYNQYKTAKNYGSITIEIPTSLSNILKKYITTNDIKPGDVIFPNSDGKYFKNFAQSVIKVFKRVSGKRISVNLIRHSFISDFLKKNPTTNQKKRVALHMGHSQETQSLYNKIDL